MSAIPSRVPRNERGDIRDLLRGPATALLRLPKDLEAQFAIYHHELALTHLQTYWPGVVVSVALICALTFATNVVPPDMFWLTVVGFACMFAVIAIVILAALLQPLNRFLVLLVGLGAWAGLLAMHVATLLAVDGSPLQTMAEYGVVFITLAVFTIANLPLKVSLAVASVALVSLLTIALFTGLAPDWQHFGFYAVGSLLIGGLTGFAQEIRERKVFLQEKLLEMEKRELDVLTHELSLLSRKDALTGLANRRHFDEVIMREWVSNQREGAVMNLVFIDVDYFKRYNDHYGHQAGDECLRRVAAALSIQALRGADFVARYGGEEFVGMFPRTGREGLEIIAKRIIEAVDQLEIPHKLSDVSSCVTVSVGVAAMVPSREMGPDALIKMADEALYRAKAAGRHRYTLSWREH